MVPRSDRSLRMCSHRLLRLCGSRPVVGSSRKTSGGSCTRPSAISSRRRCPPDSVLTSRCSRPASSSWPISSSARCRASRPADAVERGLVEQLLDDQAVRVGAAHGLADGLRHVPDLLAHAAAGSAAGRRRPRSRCPRSAAAAWSACAGWWSCPRRSARGSRRSLPRRRSGPRPAPPRHARLRLLKVRASPRASMIIPRSPPGRSQLPSFPRRSSQAPRSSVQTEARPFGSPGAPS